MTSKLESAIPNTMYSQANVRTDCLPGPGQYHIDSSRQLRKQDFRRPHNPESDGPFLLGDNDESTRVKAMARSLTTPDSGLGPGLYETAPASFFRHPPQVVIGGYAPRLAASKVRGLSYSRSVMAVQVPSGNDADGGMHSQATPDECAKASSVQHPLEQPQAAFLANCRMQGRAASPIRPCSGRPSQYSRALSPLPDQPRKPVTGVAGKGIAAVHCIPHQGHRGDWQQGCFQPPWASMRRRPGVSMSPPSNWGWLALNPDQGTFGRGAWAGDGRLEMNHQSMLTPDNSGPLLRSAEPNTPGCRVLNSFPTAASISPDPETNLRKSNSPDQYMTAPSTSQQSASLVESSLAAPLYAETKLVATIPTTTMTASAVAASGSNPIDGNATGEAGLMIANLGDAAHNSAAIVSNGNQPCALQCHHPLLHEGCNDEGAAGTLLGTAAQAESSCVLEVSSSKQGQKGDSPAPKQQLTAIQTASMQPCKGTLQTLDMYDETEMCRHRQASKAALRVLAIQEQQLMWAAKSKGGQNKSVPAWICGSAGPHSADRSCSCSCSLKCINSNM